MSDMPGDLPYRGEPPVEFPKRKKQIRNLKAEERKRYIILLVLFMLSLLVLFSFINSFQSSHDPNTLGFGIATFLVLLTLILAVNNGFRSVNKFRKGYDIDISHRKKKKDKNPPDES